MAVSSTVTIDYKDKKEGKAAAIIYGRMNAQWGSARLRAKDFDLSTIRTVQLQRNTLDVSPVTIGSQVTLIASVANSGSLGNYFELKAATAGSPVTPMNISFTVMGE